LCTKLASSCFWNVVYNKACPMSLNTNTFFILLFGVDFIQFSLLGLKLVKLQFLSFPQMRCLWRNFNCATLWYYWCNFTLFDLIEWEFGAS
jgi:hypothetical protein